MLAMALFFYIYAHCKTRPFSPLIDRFMVSVFSVRKSFFFTDVPGGAASNARKQVSKQIRKVQAKS